MRTTSTNWKIEPRKGDPVKARIVAAGLKLRDVARRAGYAPNTLSTYLGGRTRNINGQIRIHRAFCVLTGSEIRLRDFWGLLLAKEVA